MIKVDGSIDAYLATPPEGKERKATGILYLPDVIGVWQNSKLMADLFAEQGYLTIVMDLFNGDPVPLNKPPGFDLMQWLSQGSDGNNPHTKEYVDPITVKGIKALKDMGVKHIGAVGYCFGAKVRRVLLVFACNGLEITLTNTSQYNSTSSATTRMASTSATAPTRPLSRRMNWPPSVAPWPSPPPRRTPSSQPRSATSPRRFSPRPSSRTRLTCLRLPSTALLSVVTPRLSYRSLPRSRRSFRLLRGLIPFLVRGGIAGPEPSRCML